MTTVVRPVRAEEHAATGAAVLAAYDAVGRMSAGYRDELADTAARDGAGSTVLVAVDGSDLERPDVLGTITVVAGCSAHFEHPGAGDGGFRALAVVPGEQGRGVGRALVEAAIARGRDDGWRRLVITTMEWMHGAQRLYERMGFDRRADLDVRFPTGVGHAYALDLSPLAGAVFPAPGPVADEPPWYEDAWAGRGDRQPC